AGEGAAGASRDRGRLRLRLGAGGVRPLRPGGADILRPRDHPAPRQGQADRGPEGQGESADRNFTGGRQGSNVRGEAMMKPHRVFQLLACLCLFARGAQAEQKWVEATAYVVPKETATEGEGYFSTIEGLNKRLYIGPHANAV